MPAQRTADPFSRRPRPLILGHRGAPLEAPENTVPSFLRAMDLGADGLELDVQLSRDGVPVVIHDFRLERTTDGTGRVTERTLAELRGLDAGARFGPAFAGTRIPTLDEVLAALPGDAVINIELKNFGLGDEGLARAVVEAVHRHGAAERVIVSSFNPVLLCRVRRLDPGLRCGLLTMPGLPRPLARGWLVPWVRPHAIHLRRDMADPDTIARWRRRGLEVVVWDVRDPADAPVLARLGVAAIIADDPGAMRRALAGAPGEGG